MNSCGKLEEIFTLAFYSSLFLYKVMNEIAEVAERPAAGGCPQRSADDHRRRVSALVRPGRNEASAASAQDCRLSAEHPHCHPSPAARRSTSLRRMDSM